MPAMSAARPINPSSASISRTRCPLPIPPIAGLHDISPIPPRLCVIRAVRAPIRAAAAAASQPAWPPPMTTTSKFPVMADHASDAAYFVAKCGRAVATEEARAIEAAFLAAYRWQYIHSGAKHPYFGKVLSGLITDGQSRRIEAALATLH